MGTGALVGLLIEPNTSGFITLNHEVQAIIGAFGGLFYSGIYSVVRSFFKQEIIINANIIRGISKCKLLKNGIMLIKTAFR